MPEIEFYIPDEERMELFDFIVENKGSFIPHLGYETPESIKIKSREELIKCVYEQAVGFYILSPKFQIEPIVISKNEFSTDKDRYDIVQRTGGPYIYISFYRGFADDAAIKHKSTMMFHYARYMHYDSELYEEFKVSDELKGYYNMLVKFLKSKCKRVTGTNGKKYWVSKSVLEELSLS